MVVGITAAQGVKFDAIAGEGDFGSDKAQGPSGINDELMAKDQSIAADISSAQVNELALGRGFGLEAWQKKEGAKVRLLCRPELRKP